MSNWESVEAMDADKAAPNQGRLESRNWWKQVERILFLSHARIPGSNTVDMVALHPGKSVRLKRKGKLRIASSLRSKGKQASLNASCMCLIPEVKKQASLAECVLHTPHYFYFYFYF